MRPPAQTGDRAPVEVQMILRRRSQRDPFWDDGQGVRQSRARDRMVGTMAFALAVVACGLTAAAWLRTLLPIVGGPGLG